MNIYKGTGYLDFLRVKVFENVLYVKINTQKRMEKDGQGDSIIKEIFSNLEVEVTDSWMQDQVIFLFRKKKKKILNCDLPFQLKF